MASYMETRMGCVSQVRQSLADIVRVEGLIVLLSSKHHKNAEIANCQLQDVIQHHSDRITQKYIDCILKVLLK